jgi:hypothetical protein
MPNSLPIYDNILTTTNNISEYKITQNIKDNLITNINIHKDTHELLFAIIRCYQLNNSSNMTSLPFYCKYLKTKHGYKFDIDNLPDKLIIIMTEFYKLHTNSIQTK